MRLAGLAATPRPEGNAITITWTRPDPAVAPGVRVVRRRLAFPETPVPGPAAEGVVVADSDPAAGAPAPVEELPGGRRSVTDRGLAGETVYYYRVYPYTGTPPPYDEDPDNRASAMATAPYGFADLLYGLLPAIYHRYDTVLPDQVLDPAEVQAMDPADRARGQLRRFLELPGSQLDQLYSAVRSLLGLHDLDLVDGRLVPLLAHWIGWRTDNRLGLDRQRAEVRNAPALYHTIETLAAVEATVTRITGWGSRSKEFVDNVFVANRPERLTLWLARRTGQTWSFGNDPLSLDDAYAGRPVAVADAPNAVRLVYATRTADGDDIWQKRHTAGQGWSGSEPVVSRPGADTGPAAAVQDASVWVFWAAYDPDGRRWRIDFRNSIADGWSAVSTFRDGPGDQAERKAPAALVDDAGALWLFWLERSTAGWGLRYGRFDGDPWVPTPAGSVAFPDDGGADPRVESDVSVLFRPARAGDPSPTFRRLWVLWSRQEPVPGEPEQTRWRVVSRFKDGTDPADTGDWGAVAALAVADEHHHDREPAALVVPDGNLVAFWSSTRDGSWSVWQADVDVTAHTWGTPAAVTGPPFSERAPTPFLLEGGLVLAYRSNRSLTYRSSIYRATITVDRRWSGSLTARTTNAAAIALRGEFDDAAAYTYDAGPAAGRDDDDWYARDTVGLYLEPDTTDPPAVQAGKDRIRRVLPEFLPATDRAVLL
jgi:hypothetical protein